MPSPITTNRDSALERPVPSVVTILLAVVAVAALFLYTTKGRPSDPKREPVRHLGPLTLVRQIVLTHNTRQFVGSMNVGPDVAACLLFSNVPDDLGNRITFYLEAKGQILQLEDASTGNYERLVMLPRGYRTPPKDAYCTARKLGYRLKAGEYGREVGRWKVVPLPAFKPALAPAREDPRVTAQLELHKTSTGLQRAILRVVPSASLMAKQVNVFAEETTYGSRPSPIDVEPGAVRAYDLPFSSDQTSVKVDARDTQVGKETCMFTIPSINLIERNGQPGVEINSLTSVVIPKVVRLDFKPQVRVFSDNLKTLHREIRIEATETRLDPTFRTRVQIQKYTLLTPVDGYGLSKIMISGRYAAGTRLAEGPIKYGQIGPLAFRLDCTWTCERELFETIIPIKRTQVRVESRLQNERAMVRPRGRNNAFAAAP